MTVLVFVMTSVPLVAQSPTPLGDQFQVNTYTYGSQDKAQIDRDGDGNFVVVWESSSSDFDTYVGSVHARRYAADGRRLGNPFIVNTFTPGDQEYPDVAVGDEGSFVVVWQSDQADNGDSNEDSIQGQRFDAGGNPLGGQFLINTDVSSTVETPVVAADAESNFTVAWKQGLGIFARRYGSDGAPLDLPFKVNSLPGSLQEDPSIAMNGDGEFVITWQGFVDNGDDGDSSLSSIQARLFDSLGTPVGDQFLVNTYTIDSQTNARAAINDAGELVIVWASDQADNGDDSSTSIQGRRFDSVGAPLGDQFLVNSYTTGSQASPGVAIDASNSFVVVWHGRSPAPPGETENDVQGRRFEADGTPLGDQFGIPSSSSLGVGSAEVVAGDLGDFIVSWQASLTRTDLSFNSVQAQRFCDPECSSLFTDGFESGDTAAWSASTHP